MEAWTSLTIERAEELVDRLRIRSGEEAITVLGLLDALNDCKLTLTHDTSAASEAYWAYAYNQRTNQKPTTK